MKRWTLKSGGYDADVLIIEDVQKPEPGPGQVRVRVRVRVRIEAAALNYRDYLVMTNALWRTNMDLIPVADGAGVIDAVITMYMRDFPDWPPHPDVGMGLGSANEDGVLAEYVVLSAFRLARKPASLTSIGQVSTYDIPIEAAKLASSSAIRIGTMIGDIHTQYHQIRPWLLLDEKSIYTCSAMPQKRNPGLLMRTRESA